MAVISSSPALRYPIWTDAPDWAIAGLPPGAELRRGDSPLGEMVVLYDTLRKLHVGVKAERFTKDALPELCRLLAARSRDFRGRMISGRKVA